MRYHSFYMRRTILTLFVLANLFPAAAFAATAPVSGDLIKASGPAVYYFGADQKRYVFPTDKIYFSWYTDFSGVKTISDADLATYPLGGNVTYRPGVRLVKVTTDPKTYAVASNGVLRWIQSEAAALALYGTDWAKRVDDLPDAFFVNYRIGTAIASAADYQPSQETTAASTINQDRRIGVTVPVTPPVTPAPTSTQPIPPVATTTVPIVPTYSAAVSASDPNPLRGQTIQLLGSALPTTGLMQVQLFFDNVLQNTCSQSPCTVNVTIPTNGVYSSFEMRTEANWMNNQRSVATSTVVVSSDQNKAILLTVRRPEVRMDSNREVLVDVDQSFIVSTMDIYVDDNIVQGCDGLQHCRYTGRETSATGTIHTTYAVAYDTNGTEIRSQSKTFSVVDDEHPIAGIETSKTQIYKNETVDVTVTASDDNNVAWTEIRQGATVVKHCLGSSCTATVGPWTQPQSVQFIGIAEDTNGLRGQTTSSVVLIQ